MTRRVLKLGGSLLPQTGWREALALLVQRVHEPLVIVPGGGVFADAVRHAQASIGFDEHAAHEMAILAMAQTACVLRGACPGLPLEATPRAIEAAWATHAVVVWQPTVMPETPASWDISADSLAAWLAAQLGAQELVLVKSCALPEPARSQGSGAQAQAAWRRWAEAGAVDGRFAGYALAAGAEVRLLRLNDVPGWVQDLPAASTSERHALPSLGPAVSSLPGAP